MKKLQRMLVGLLLLVPALALAEVSQVEMVFVKGGCFQMGDTFGEGESDEKPVHEVCVDDFYIGKYEVTQDQYRAVMGANPSHFKGGSRPVENVHWSDAQEFTHKLRAKTGKQYRLPYEAEWEYAARSGGALERFSGTSNEGNLSSYAWFADNSHMQTQPVGKLEPNGLGIFDMSGNVWEWCRDRYAEDFYRYSPAKNPSGAVSGPFFVRRGGSWYYAPKFLRASFRNFPSPGYRNNDIGFRLALSAVP